MISKRSPRFAKHASVLSTLAAAGAAWLLVHRFDKVKEYHTPVIVGASIAAVQTVVQAYLPKYGWMVSDYDLNAASPPTQAAQIAAGNKVAASFNTSSTALPAPIATLSAEEISDELDDLDLGSLSGDYDGGLSDYEMDELIDESNLN